MKIIALPDLHTDTTNLFAMSDVLSQADLILLVGDLTNGGSLEDASQVIKCIQEFNPSVLAVPGNWDKPEVAAYLSHKGINLHRKHVLIDGLTFIGIGYRCPELSQRLMKLQNRTSGGSLQKSHQICQREFQELMWFVCKQVTLGCER